MFKKIVLTFTLALTLFAVLVAPAQAHAFGLTPDWDAVQTQATAITQQAQTVTTAAQNIQTYAAQIQAQESDPAVQALAADLIALAAQTEQDAAAIMVTANDINTRIDNSEATTLTLADDIGEMADRIGEMADRILWTEGQIGIMADRIVESEYLISDSSLALAGMIQSEADRIAGSAANIQTSVALIQALLP